MPQKMNNHRVFVGESSRCRPDGAASRREEAIEREKEYSKLTPSQKLALLDQKFGSGNGAAKQRAKLKALLEKGNNPQASSGAPQMEASAEALAEIDDINNLHSKKRSKEKDRR